MRALVHSGLALLWLLAPALCCCNFRSLTAKAVASVVLPSAASQTETRPPVHSCCHSGEPVKKKSCCHETKPTQPQPPAPQPSQCKCLDQRPDATPPEHAAAVKNPQPTGELLPLALIGLSDISPEHLGLRGGLMPPERAGVDTRFATLFDRHVLRC